MDNGAMALAYVSHSSNYNMVDGMQTYYTNGSAIDPSASMPGGHGVTLVGWDDNFSRNNFCEEMRPENDGAWLCKNSWGVNNCSTAEGYEGYFWMSYESEIRDFSQFIMQSADEFDNIYQNQLALDCSVELISAANVFTAEKVEVLEQICFSNIGAADITFEIYKLSEGYTSPTDGKLLTSFKDHVDYTGTHYIDVPEQVELGEGDMFSVVLKSDDVFNVYQKIEGPNVLENKGFVMFSEDYWEDVTEEYLDNVGYMCIKALTSNKNGVVYKDELSQLIDEAENVSVDENVLQTSKDKFNTAIEKAKNVLNDSTVSQNTVDNTYCILNNEINEIKESVYEINSLDDFIDLQSKSEYGKYSNAYIILNTDLDFSDYEMQPSLFETDMYGGVFDGKGHTISNLKINSDCEVGLFSKLKNAEIRNLKLENCSFKSDELAGSIAGLAKNSLVTNCTVTNSKIVSKNNDAAGIVGLAEDTRIVNSSVKQSEIIGKTTATIIALLRGTE